MVELYNGDCLEVMKNIKDKSIDLILCDLPYNQTHNEWDKIIPFDKLWNEYKRVRKPTTPIILFSQGKFTYYVIGSNISEFRYTLVWDKVRTTGFLNANKMPLRRHEDICVFYEKLPTYNPQMTEGASPSHSRGKKWEGKGMVQDNRKVYGKYNHIDRTFCTTTNLKHPTSILTFLNTVNKHHVHPTQKPVELLEYLIKTYSNENDLVLDNCMGSGSVGVACKNTNRNFIGIELDKKYFDIAKERIGD